MNLGISLELVLLMFSIYPTFDEMSTAEEWVESNLGETASVMPFSFRYGDAFSSDTLFYTDSQDGKATRRAWDIFTQRFPSPIRVFQLIAKMDSRFRANDIIPNLSFPRKRESIVFSQFILINEKLV